MSRVKLIEADEVPPEGGVRRIHLVHPLTDYKYDIALYRVQGKYNALADGCKFCAGTLSQGQREGRYVFCSMEEHGWNIKNGVCKFDRTEILPTYKVEVADDGLYIEI